jgi:hypothetical protein
LKFENQSQKSSIAILNQCSLNFLTFFMKLSLSVLISSSSISIVILSGERLYFLAVFLKNSSKSGSKISFSGIFIDHEIVSLLFEIFFIVSTVISLVKSDIIFVHFICFKKKNGELIFHFSSLYLTSDSYFSTSQVLLFIIA